MKYIRFLIAHNCETQSWQNTVGCSALLTVYHKYQLHHTNSKCLLLTATVILAHNHPSGYLGASEADKRITKTIKAALKLVDIKFLDHLILTYEEKYSTIETDAIGSG